MSRMGKPVNVTALRQVAKEFIQKEWVTYVTVESEHRYTKPDEVKGKHLRPEIYIGTKVLNLAEYKDAVMEIEEAFPIKLSKSFYKQFRDPYVYLMGYDKDITVKVALHMPDELFGEIAGCEVVAEEKTSPYTVYSCKVKNSG